MSSATIAGAIERVLSAYAELTELGEGIEDEWSYVNDLAGAWRERLEAVAAARGETGIDPISDDAIERAIDEIGRIDRPAPRDRLAVDLSAGDAADPRRDAVRFQDAARDGRAIVYAGIQADPLVKRAAGLLADAAPAQRVLARAVMNGESTDRRWLAPDVPDAVRAGRAAGPERTRSEAILAAASRSPSGASRSAASSAGRSSRS